MGSGPQGPTVASEERADGPQAISEKKLSKSSEPAWLTQRMAAAAAAVAARRGRSRRRAAGGAHRAAKILSVVAAPKVRDYRLKVRD